MRWRASMTVVAVVALVAFGPPGRAFAANLGPVAVDDFYSFHGTTLTVPAPGVLANDSDPDGGVLTAALGTSPAHGNASVHADGSLMYQTGTPYVGQDVFTYELYDGQGGMTTGQVTVEVTNSLPVGANRPYTAQSDHTLYVSWSEGVLSGATDADGDGLWSELVGSTTHGSLDFSGAAGSFNYTPDPGYLGPDSFTFVLRDAWQASVTYTASIDVVQANRPPVGVTDSYTVHGLTELVVEAPGVLANDTDLDGDTLRVVDISRAPTKGTLEAWGADGSFTYFAGSTLEADSFTYVVLDEHGDFAYGTVTIGITNRPPTLTGAAYSVPSDHSIQVEAPGLVANANDPDGDPLYLRVQTEPAHGTVQILSNGGFTYWPAPAYVGEDSFTFSVSDGWASSPARTVVLTVWDSNHAPTAVDDTYSIHAGQQLWVSAPGLLANDVDPDGNALSIEAPTSPSGGDVYVSSNGSVLYTPAATFTGTDSFAYTVTDGRGGRSSATVYVNVTNTPPTADDREYTTPTNVTLTVSPLGYLTGASDAENDPVLGEVTGGPSHGRLTSDAWGGFTYTPDGVFVGDDSFTFVPKDTWSTGPERTVTIHVTPFDPPPVAVADTYTVHAGGSLLVDAPGLLANDSDPDGDAIAFSSIVTPPAHGWIYPGTGGSFVYNTDSEEGFVGTDSFTYVVVDSKGAVSAPATVTIDVTNSAPTARDSSYSTMMSTSLVVAAPGFMTGAADADGDTVYPWVSPEPTHGTLTWDGDGSFTYEPSSGYAGDDSFTFVVYDGFGPSDPHTVTIHVVSPDRAPVPAADTYTVRKNASLKVGAPGVLANDSDPDGDVMTAVLVTTAAHGSLKFNANGSFNYEPARNFTGVDTFTYKVLANGKYSDVVTVTLNVAKR